MTAANNLAHWNVQLEGAFRPKGFLSIISIHKDALNRE
jgi:hypothetical protein